MPFGLHSTPATFQWLLDEILGPELEMQVFVYLDDIIIINKTFNEKNLDTLREVFRCLREAKLRLKPDMPVLRGSAEIRRVHRRSGDHMNRSGNSPGRRAIVRSKNRKIDSANFWVWPFIIDFATVAALLTVLTRKNARWHWGPDEATAFE